MIFGWAASPSLFFFLSVSSFSLRSAPVQHLAGWQEEEQQGETDPFLVSFTLLLLLIIRERILLFPNGKRLSRSESLRWDDNINPLGLTHYLYVFLLQSAAALCVGVGSFADPDDLPGLAHFLEHSKIFIKYHSWVFFSSALYYLISRITNWFDRRMFNKRKD